MQSHENLCKTFKRKLTVEKVKTELRNKYITNLKSVRQNNIDKHRNLTFPHLSVDIVRNEIEDSLLKWNYEPEDIEEIIKDIKDDDFLNELNISVEEYLANEENITEEMIKTHLNVCTICEQYFQPKSTETTVICDKCIEINFKDITS